jgi:NAD(P)H-flavin reductase/cytochrome b involved in lipid metabolism
MHDTDMIIAYIENSKVKLLDTWSTHHALPDNDSDLGGTMDYTLLNYTVSQASDSFYVAFSRPLVTNDKYDKQLALDGTTDICWAWYHRSIKNHHGQFGSGRLYMGYHTAKFVDDGQPYSEAYKKHGYGMTIAWGILAVLAIFVARYFKQFKIWLWIHLILGSLIIAVTAYSIRKMYRKNDGKYEEFDENQTRHSRVGLMMFVLLFAQGFLGLASAFLIWNKKPILQKAAMRRAHRIIGWFMTLFGFWNLWTGWDMYDDDKQALIMVCYIVSGILFVVLEIRHQLAQHFPKIKFLDCRRSSLPEMTHPQALDMIHKESKKWAFYDEFVIDVAPFVNSHPGGAIFIKKAYGEDMGKYINGSSSYGKNYLPYDHTNQARDLAERLAIARIPYPEEVFLKKSSRATMSDMSWKLVSKSNIARDTLLLRLSSNEFELVNSHLSPSNFGKHFLVTANIKGLPIRRYYSLMLVDYEKWTASVLGSSYAQYKIAPMTEDLPDARGNLLKLIMRIYENGRVTSYIDNYGPGLALNLKGPLGPGLALGADYRGNYIAIVGGTGLITVLDFVYFIWNQAQINQGELKDVRLFLYVSFRSHKDAFGVELLRACAKQCTNLKVHVHYSEGSDGSEEKLSPELLRREYAREMNRIWICGPSGFNRWANQMLKKEGVSKETVMIL